MNPFFPEEEYPDTYVIPYEKLYAMGIRGIIFDIDNTLVPPDAPADTRSRELFRRLRAIGLKTCLVSNNKGPRIRPFAEALRTPYVASHGDHGDKAGGDHFHRRPDLYRYLGREADGDPRRARRTHGAEGGTSDPSEATL